MRVFLKHNSKGLSLLEAFLAATIFLIAASSIILTLNGLRRPVINNEQAIGAALALSNVLEDLRSKVDARDIDAGALAAGEYEINGISGIYNVTYEVVVDPDTGVRQVDARVDWDDPV